MSLFTLMPEWAIHLIFSVGLLGIIAGFVLGFLPFIQQYVIPVKIISLLIFALGLYLEGGLAKDKQWELKIKDMEKKVAEAEAKAANVNTEIVEKVVVEKQIVKIKGDKIIEYIDREVKIYDDKCIIPEVAIKAHNMAAKNEIPLDESKK